MARSRKKVLAYGDRFNIYISELIDQELLDFINKQTDLTATIMTGLIKLYQEHGDENLANILPRSYSVHSYIPGSNNSKPVKPIDKIKETGTTALSNAVVPANEKLVEKNEVTKDKTQDETNEQIPTTEKSVSENNLVNSNNEQSKGVSGINANSMANFASMIYTKKKE